MDASIIYTLGYIIATKADHCWVQYGEDTIIKYKVIGNKKNGKHMERYHEFVTVNIRDKNLDKLVLDNTTLNEAADILLFKK